TVTWLITLGVLESPKKSISDPEGFLQTSLKDGVVLCKLLERLRPGFRFVEKIYQEPRSDAERLGNIREFTFEVNDLFLGQNFSKVLNSLVALNKATADIGVGSDSACTRHSTSHRIKSFDSLGSQTTSGRTSTLLQNRSLDMTENSFPQAAVKARFNFQQTNEDELSFTKGDIIHVTRMEEGGWWEGVFNGKTGWFPSNYVREVLQNILETETEYSKELQNLLSNYLRSLQSTEKLSNSDIAHILGNLEEINTFQQMLVQSLEECTKLPESQQRVGGFFLNLMPQMKGLYVAYCANHPCAVNVLTEHSKPFTRLEKYPTLLKELERHMEDFHLDRPDIQKCMTSFKNLSV
ncbi:hypothetical protein Z043_110014, partial [Scleropages formosus]